MIPKRFDYKKLFNELVDFSYQYIKDNSLSSVVLGISGGIDSTVVAAIMYETVKKFQTENPNDIFTFYGYSLPTNTTNNSEYFVSTLVGNAFCQHPDYDNKIFFETVNIEDITSKIIDFTIDNTSLFSKETFRKGNIKARFRMMYLYDKAKEHRGMVVGTDNYTEKLLGFSTIGGDALADYMPLQNLWKTEVYGLAKYLLEKYKFEENWQAVNALDMSINLAPQDGLGISNNDMAQIGAKDYYQVDEILYQYEKYLEYLDMGGYEYKFNNIVIEPLLADNHKREVIDNVLKRRINNFKLKLPIEFVPYEIDE